MLSKLRSYPVHSSVETISQLESVETKETSEVAMLVETEILIKELVETELVETSESGKNAMTLKTLMKNNENHVEFEKMKMS